MKKVRREVFETNSSSSHSISISNKEGMLETILPDEDGVIYLQGGDFGWEYEKYNDALTKANYCAQDNGHNPNRTNMLIEVIMEHTGAKSVIIERQGYIDHQSCGTSYAAFVDNETLKQFIFNPNSILYTGNDNDCGPINFYWNDDDVCNFELSLEGCSEIIKFKEEPDINDIKDNIYNLWDKNNHNDYNHDYDKPFYSLEFWDRKDDFGNNISSSFHKMDQNIISIYKIQRKYFNNRTHHEVLDTLELKFNLRKVN